MVFPARSSAAVSCPGDVVHAGATLDISINTAGLNTLHSIFLSIVSFMNLVRLDPLAQRLLYDVCRYRTIGSTTKSQEFLDITYNKEKNNISLTPSSVPNLPEDTRLQTKFWTT